MIRTGMSSSVSATTGNVLGNSGTIISVVIVVVLQRVVPGTHVVLTIVVVMGTHFPAPVAL